MQTSRPRGQIACRAIDFFGLPSKQESYEVEARLAESIDGAELCTH